MLSEYISPISLLLSQIVLRVAAMLHRHAAQADSWGNVSQFTASEHIWGPTGLILPSLCVEMPVEQITNESRRRNDKITMNVIAATP